MLETIYRVMSRTTGDSMPVTRIAGEGGQVPARVPAATPLNVLVAEDNEFNSQLLEQLLGRRRPPIAAGQQRPRGPGHGGDSKPSTSCSLDIHMPELDGFQVARAIRERERTAGGHLPIIALTAPLPE